MLAFYNGDGLRVKKQDFWTPWHDYTWGLGGVLVDSSDGGNGVNNTIVYTPGVSQDVNGSDSFFDVDWLGSTRYLTDSTGNNATAQERYDAFGEASYTSPTNWDPSNLQWASDWGYQAEWSASYEPGIGLEYVQNRYYDPAVGRFISADPIGFLDGLSLYEYASSDPVNEVDPDGLAAHGVPQLPDLENAPDSELGGRGETFTTRPFLHKASQLAGTGRNAIEFVGSFNEVTNAGLAANDIGAHHYGSAFLRLLGPVLQLGSVIVGGGRLTGWLRAFHEGPELGHTFEHLHVAATDAQLIARLAAGKIKAASTFLDEAVAEAAISRAIAANRPGIQLWLRAGAAKPLPIEFYGAEVIGRGIAKGEATVGPRSNVLVLLRSNGKGGFFIRAAYPF